jgi:hypothetical protein
MDQVWGEYVPNWIAALGTAGALIAAILAAYFAWRSWNHQQGADRTQRAIGLSAWWVDGLMEGRQVWGVVVSNTSDAVFRNITISPVINDVDNRSGIRFTAIPPGRYFIESLVKTEPRVWASEIALRDDQGLRPVTDANRRNIREITYIDPSGNRWRWSPDRGRRGL